MSNPDYNIFPPEQCLYPVQPIIPKEIHAQSTTSALPTSTSTVPQENIPRRVKIVKSKEQIQEQYPELFKGIG